MEAESTHPLRSQLLTKCLETLLAHKTELQARGVLHAAIFGSVARGDDDEKSDLDLEEEFSREFGRSVDIVTMGGLKSPKHDHIRREMVMAF
jgi:predicted nucleotidyltransferase